MTTFKIFKVCNSCGKIHNNIPDENKISTWGIWWDCSCGSTLLLRVSSLNLREEIKAEFKKVAQ